MFPVYRVALAIRSVSPAVRGSVWKVVRVFRTNHFDPFYLRVISQWKRPQLCHPFKGSIGLDIAQGRDTKCILKPEEGRSSNIDMDNIRGSLSKMKKEFKHRLAGGKRKQDGTGAIPGGEGTDSTNPLSQPELRVVADEGYGGEGDRANPVGGRDFSTDRPPQPAEPEYVPARGGSSGQEGGEAGVDAGKVNQRHSSPHPNVAVTVGSGRSGELEGIYPFLPAPSISHRGKPDGT